MQRDAKTCRWSETLGPESMGVLLRQVQMRSSGPCRRGVIFTPLLGRRRCIQQCMCRLLRCILHRLRITGHPPRSIPRVTDQLRTPRITPNPRST